MTRCQRIPDRRVRLVVAVVDVAAVAVTRRPPGACALRKMTIGTSEITSSTTAIADPKPEQARLADARCW